MDQGTAVEDLLVTLGDGDEKSDDYDVADDQMNDLKRAVTYLPSRFRG